MSVGAASVDVSVDERPWTYLMNISSRHALGAVAVYWLIDPPGANV